MLIHPRVSIKMAPVKGLVNVPEVKNILKRAEPYKSDIGFLLRILSLKIITTFFKRMEIMTFDTQQQLSAIISPYKLLLCHSRKGCLFSLEQLVTQC